MCFVRMKESKKKEKLTKEEQEILDLKKKELLKKVEEFVDKNVKKYI